MHKPASAFGAPLLPCHVEPQCQYAVDGFDLWLNQAGWTRARAAHSVGTAASLSLGWRRMLSTRTSTKPAVVRTKA